MQTIALYRLDLVFVGCTDIGSMIAAASAAARRAAEADARLPPEDRVGDASEARESLENWLAMYSADERALHRLSDGDRERVFDAAWTAYQELKEA